MNVLLIGGGGRESAIAWKISQSKLLRTLYVSPGNGGTSDFGINVPGLSIIEAIDFVKKNKVDLTIVGPEAPLTEGIVDEFRIRNLTIFGPTKSASKIEGSKIWAKDLFKKYSIPCAKSDQFSDLKSSLEFFINNDPSEWVIKVNGIASGKGVFMPENLEEAREALTEIFVENRFGKSGEKILIEERLHGVEVSVFTLVNNNKVSNCIAACDYKRIKDGDRGPNTGGMGAISPPSFWNSDMESKIKSNIIMPTVDAMINEGCSFTGVLFAGLIITKKGIKVLEFNCRFGDPETQVFIPRIKSDLLEILLKYSTSTLEENTHIELETIHSTGVVLASKGYPEKFALNKEIDGLSESNQEFGSIVFQAGTKSSNLSKIYTDGGRVLICVGLGKSYEESRELAYKKVESIKFDGMYYRKDIGENRDI
tara:strand:+ start:5855 stop:7126 length:1272 start_codon:yes stop_codon:yes gene_type:complete